MNSRIQLVRRCHLRCCQWGLRQPIPAIEYIGGPVPLLKNPLSRTAGQLAIFNTVVLFVTVVVVIVVSVRTGQLQGQQQAALLQTAQTNALAAGKS